MSKDLLVTAKLLLKLLSMDMLVMRKWLNGKIQTENLTG